MELARQYVLRRPALRLRNLPLRLELLLAAVTAIRDSSRDQLARNRAVARHTLRLAIRRMRSADIGTFVPHQSEPAKIVEHHRLRLGSRPRLIRILDADDERAAVMLRKQPVENRRARAADVEVP